jgi:riboflavin kinase/FMN adenylyltransferase
VTAGFGVDDPAPPGTTDAAVAIGNFDGVHLGHHRLIAVLRAEARRLCVPAVALCLYPHPLSLLRPESAPATLLWPERRAKLLRESGADEVAFLETTPRLLELTAEQFFNDVLLSKLRIRALVEGENFRFGRGRTGDVPTLQRLCREAGVSMTPVSLADDDDSAVSSTRIREAGASGDLAEVEALSGRRHRIRGIVGVGAKRGRTIGFPTANLEQVQGLVPSHGVYAVAVHFDDGRRFAGACNIGPNPTFGEGATKIETHLLDFHEDVYGQPLEVEFIQRLREVKTFSGIEELTGQIHRDVAAAREACGAMTPEPIRRELAQTISEWLKWDAGDSLAPVGISLEGAAFDEPTLLRLDWRIGGAMLPHVAMDLLFGLEERLRKAFPEVDHVTMETIKAR